MDAKIKFLDDFSLDRKLYWRVSDIYQRYQWEIVFDKGTPEALWKIRRHGADDWHPMNVKNLYVELSARQVDVAEFDRQLSGNIMTQAVFSSSLLEEAKKILGDKVIAEAISNHNDFAEKLLEMIRDLTRDSKSESLSTSERSSVLSQDFLEDTLTTPFEMPRERKSDTSKRDFPFAPEMDREPGLSDRKNGQKKWESSFDSKHDQNPQVKKTDTLLRLVKK